MKRGLGRNPSNSNLSTSGMVTPAKSAAGSAATPFSTGKRGAHSAYKQTPVYTPGTSLLAKLKSPAPGTHNVDDNASVVSATTGRSGTLAETLAEIQTTKEKLLSTLHERTEESENFVVTASDGGQFRIMIGDRHKFGERGRINAVQLKKLFLHKPDIAEILYDTLVEEGIVVEEPEEGSQLGDFDDLDALGISMEDIHLMQESEGLGQHAEERKGAEGEEEDFESY